MDWCVRFNLDCATPPRPEVNDRDNDLFADDEDCDDDEPAAFPNNDEICDGIDNDCDGLIDEDFNKVWYIDNDDDGYGGDQSFVSCEQFDNYVQVPGDCDDLDDQVSPAAPEICDRKDNDCDGARDEALLIDYYVDDDADGFGDREQVRPRCPGTTEPGLSDLSGDCDDTDPLAYPGAIEVCFDGVDNDCDTFSDEAGCRPDVSILQASAVADNGNAFGGLLVHAGDLNGDGAPDVLAGSIAALHVLYGPLRLPAQLTDFPDQIVFSEDERLSEFAIGAETDFNGDGQDDLLIGLDPAEGMSILLGPFMDDIDLSDAAAQVTGNRSVHFIVGDTDDDGFDEIFSIDRSRSAFDAYEGDIVNGEFRLIEQSSPFLGSYARLVARRAVRLDDLDGDGVDDFLVEGLAMDNAPAITAIYTDPLPVNDPTAQIAGDYITIQPIGDTNGDGYPDLIALKAGINASGLFQDDVLWFPGPFDDARGDADAVARLLGPALSRDPRMVVAAAGDLEQDRSDDFILVVTGERNPDASYGRAYGFTSAVSGVVDLSDADLLLPMQGLLSDRVMTAIGEQDVTGDGAIDVLLGTPSSKVEGAIGFPGAVRLFSGAAR
ncbi:MAG: putative metal-binding motif-containing protein [Myxococcota bacterium]